MAKGVNCLHTAENYSLIYKKKGRKYTQLKTQQSKLFEMLESDEIKNKKPMTKKLQKINRKLELTTKMPTHKQEIEPDYIKEIATESGKTFQDKRTYIQCFDEKLANEFKNIAQNETESTSKPAVAQINFNAKSKLAPLIVSSPDHKTFEEGYSLIAQKMLETIDDPENKNAFPIKISVFEPENDKINGKFKTLNNKIELLSFCGVENNTEKSTEK